MGAYNGTYSSALWPPEKDLPRQPSAAKVQLPMFEMPKYTFQHRHVQTSAVAIIPMFEVPMFERSNIGSRCLNVQTLAADL